MATAILTWLRDINNANVLIYTDNKTIVDIWHTGSTKCQDMMAIIRHLFFFTAKRNIRVTLQHVYGYNNTNADLLSRMQVGQFRGRCRMSEEHESKVPTDIWDICKD